MSRTFNAELALSIIIVNFRTPQYVVECLATLLPEVSDLKARIVVVDNNSEDDSDDVINSWIKNHDSNRIIDWVQANTNSGFSSGNNIGINTQKADYYLLLNSDTFVRPDAIKILLETARSRQDTGLISPRLEWPQGEPQESCFRFPKPLSEFGGAAQTGLLDRLLNRYRVAMPVESKCTYPQWTSFACVLIKHDVFQQLGLMDERYFMYFEDVEFCHRAAKAGWKIINQPKARVVHLRGGSSSVKENIRHKKRLPRYYYESRTLYFYSTYGWWGLTLANLMWESGRLISKSRQVLGRRDKAAIARQWKDIWINWLTPLASYTRPDAKR